MKPWRIPASMRNSFKDFPARTTLVIYGQKALKSDLPVHESI